VTALESYLTGDVLSDRGDIATIESVLGETASTIEMTFKDTHWPYEVRRGAALTVGKLSQSTTAMMIHAIDLLLDTPETNGGKLGYVFTLNDDPLGKKLSCCRKTAADALFDEIKKAGNKTFSKTYGRNDPLTLSFLAEVWLHSGSKPDCIKELISTKANEHMQLDLAKDAESFFDFNPESTSNGDHSNAASNASRVDPSRSTPLTNAFIPLRVLRTCRVIGLDPPKGYRIHLRYFESTLHDQLSFISIPDSRWILLKKVEASCDRYLIAGGGNVEAEWEQGPAV